MVRETMRHFGSIPRLVDGLFWGQVLLLLALAMWFRVTSLDAIQELSGDECWYAVQASHLVSGQAVTGRTISGSPLNPFFVGMQVPLLLAFRPSLWIVRGPAALCGILAVVLTYSVGRRVLDATTALIAGVIIAALPMAIYYSRYGIDASQIPLCGLLVLFFAFRGRGKALGLAFLGSLFVHPTNVFLLPMAVPVYLVQSLRGAAADPARRRRIVIATLAMSVLAVLAVAAWTLPRIYVRLYYEHLCQPQRHWLLFLTSYGRFFSGISLYAFEPLAYKGEPLPAELIRLHDGLFWGVVSAVCVFGVGRLVETRRWERIALFVGLMLGLAGFHLAAGSHVLFHNSHRYGVVLIVPSVLAFACLVEALLAAPVDPLRMAVRRLQLAAVCLVAWGLLFGFKTNYFDAFTAGGRESIWTLRAEQADPSKRAMSLILRDIDRNGAAAPNAGREVVIAESWWAYRPLQFFALSRRDVVVAWYEKMGDLAQRPIFLDKHLAGGAYAVGFPQGPIEQFFASVPPARFQRWEVRRRDGKPFLTVYRYRHAGAEPRPGDQSAPPALSRAKRQHASKR
jgi:hypothetical protein